jgi:hypothetical protein
MPFHAVALSRQEVAGGALRFQDQLANALRRRAVELTEEAGALRAGGYVGGLNVERRDVEVLTLAPFPFDEFVRVRNQFGERAFSVLFLNDAAREACERLGIELEYARAIPEGELPRNTAVFLRLPDYGNIMR